MLESHLHRIIILSHDCSKDSDSFARQFFSKQKTYEIRRELSHVDIMASRFSGVLQLTDLDDFITPSQVYIYLF